MARDDQYPHDNEDYEEYQDLLRERCEAEDAVRQPATELTDEQIAEIGALHEPDYQAF